MRLSVRLGPPPLPSGLVLGTGCAGEPGRSPPPPPPPPLWLLPAVELAPVGRMPVLRLRPRLTCEVVTSLCSFSMSFTALAAFCSFSMSLTAFTFTAVMAALTFSASRFFSSASSAAAPLLPLIPPPTALPPAPPAPPLPRTVLPCAAFFRGASWADALRAPAGTRKADAPPAPLALPAAPPALPALLKPTLPRAPPRSLSGQPDATVGSRAPPVGGARLPASRRVSSPITSSRSIASPARL